MENMELSIHEMAKVHGGIGGLMPGGFLLPGMGQPLPQNQDQDEHKDGGATGSW